MTKRDADLDEDLGIAIIGLAGRFPGAPTARAFWDNLRTGTESISFLSDDELRSAGVAGEVLARGDYVKAGAFLDHVDDFDAGYFGYSPGEAEYIDPQHRVFLECAVEALEDAGCDPERYDGSIGVFAGAAPSHYQRWLLETHREDIRALDAVTRTLIDFGTDTDYLSTRLSYKLNLKGPSLTIQTACSTSLVAVHVACQNLLSAECDVALAGGVSIIKGPRRTGYVYVDGGIVSPDGHCRPFDEGAKGTVFGDGAGIVVLKRVKDALADRNRIYAIIRGSAVNNDGAAKVGFTAPSIDGQAAVISEALSIAGFDPETVDYVETHGTGTALGDQIEIAALKKVFGESRGWSSCVLGTLKANIGHLNTAAGVAGLIKVAMALHHRQMPPSVNFDRASPELGIARSPFSLLREAGDWSGKGRPRRAGVSAFGIGGTNVHVALEEAPAATVRRPSKSHHLLLVSACSAPALAEATANIVGHLQKNPAQAFADVCFTLGTGRRMFAHRTAILADSAGAAICAYESNDMRHMATGVSDDARRQIVFMFPGQGTQYAGMANGLYGEYRAFRGHVEICNEILKPQLGTDLREVFLSDDGKTEELLRDTAMAQPAIFVASYAVAKLWESWGVRPSAMIGHSLGELVAACVSQVFSLEDALTLVAERARIMQELPRGRMLAVPLPYEELREYESAELSLAAENGPHMSLISGTAEAVEAAKATLQGRGVMCVPLRTSHAFHSPMMDPIVDVFSSAVARKRRQAPRIPYISNVTGTWVSPEEATSAAYWGRHLRAPVRFWSGLKRILGQDRTICVEAGPGRTLTNIVRDVGDALPVKAVPSLPAARSGSHDREVILRAAADLWVAGHEVDWTQMFADDQRGYVTAPSYPFQRKRCWLAGPKLHGRAAAAYDVSRAGAPRLPDSESVPAVPAPHGDPRDMTDVEAVMAEIWRALLKLERIGLDDDFFELGGHSLLVLQLASRLRDRFGVELSPQDLFAARTISKSAALIEHKLLEELEEIEALGPATAENGAGGMAYDMASDRRGLA